MPVSTCRYNNYIVNLVFEEFHESSLMSHWDLLMEDFGILRIFFQSFGLSSGASEKPEICLQICCQCQ